MFNVTAFELLLGGVLLIYTAERVTRWMHRRGRIRWKMRGTSSALGNAVMGVQVFYQPQVKEVLQARLTEDSGAGESGDPPEPGAHR